MKKVKVSCTRIVGDKVEQIELEGIEEPIVAKGLRSLNLNTAPFVKLQTKGIKKKNG